MNILHINQISFFTVLGLKAICTVNRDIVSGYNSLSRKHIIQLLTNRINSDFKFIIPPFIYKETDYFLKSYHSTIYI